MADEVTAAEMLTTGGEAAAAETGPGGKKRGGKRAAILLAALLILGAAGGAWWQYTGALSRAKTGYALAMEANTQAAALLEDTIKTAGELAEHTAGDTVADQSVLELLEARIAAGNELMAKGNELAQETVEGNRAVYLEAAGRAEALTPRFQTAADELRDAMDAVAASKLLLAVRRLDALAAELDEYLQEYEGRVDDEAVLVALADRLTEAKALLDNKEAALEDCFCVTGMLEQAGADVLASHDLWQEEQDRLAEEEAARRRAATNTPGGSGGVDYSHPLVAAAREYIGSRQGYCWELVQISLEDLDYPASGEIIISPMTGRWYYNYVMYRELCQKVPITDLKPGDIIEYGPDMGQPGPIAHVAIYIGGGRAIHGNYDYDGLVVEAGINIGGGKALTRAYRLEY